MLDSVEILDLEKRWKKWRFKSYTKIAWFAGIGLVFVLLSVLVIKLLPALDSSLEQKEVESAQIPHEQIKKTANEQIKIPTHSYYQKPYVPKEPKLPQTQYQQNPNNIEVIDDTPYKTTTRTTQRATREPEVEYEEDSDVYEPDDFEIEEIPQEVVKVVPPKPKIEIETSQIKPKKDNYKNIKEKFYATNNIVYALMIAEEYYHSGDYSNALKWALISNNIDSSNERSWIIFAKSKVKNGQREDALKALNGYLQHYPNATEIKSLIQKIKQGRL